MDNIKNSIESKYRIYQIKALLFIGLIIIILSLCPSIFILFKYQVFESLYFLLLLPIIFVLLIFLPFIIYYYINARYLINNNQNFILAEAILDKPSTSFLYSRSVYFSLNITIDNKTITIDTNPLFSTGLFSFLDLSECNNKKVVVFYDKNKDKAYVKEILS